MEYFYEMQLKVSEYAKYLNKYMSVSTMCITCHSSFT